ncbi:MAG TPA: hypothetical protein VFF20_09265 [Pseudogracilibacillus sp.]|nr:hypothetical protein [Pseudogracilibacillus sp.]
MRKFTLVFAVMMTMLFLVACGNEPTMKSDDTTNDDSTTTVEENKKEEIAKEDGEENVEEEAAKEDGEENEKGELSLQVLKTDQDDGLTIENNEIYKTLDEAVAADPLMGKDKDLSLYPYDLLEYEDGSTALILLVINRLEKPIRNLAFKLTFGNDEGEYIFDKLPVDLPEDYLGVLDTEGVVPVFLQLKDEEKDFFATLTEENVYLKLDDVGIDFVD